MIESKIIYFFLSLGRDYKQNKYLIYIYIFKSLGRDYKHSLEMQKLLKNEIGSIDVFLLLFSGAATR